MTKSPNDPWYSCLPSCQTQVPCGSGWHTVRWEAGQLRLPEHPDAEAELVLAALGGDKARCVELAEAWGRHTSDLSVLRVGPRSLEPGEITVGWPDVETIEQGGQAGPAGHAARWRGWHGPQGARPAALGQLASPPPQLAGLRARQAQAQAEAEAASLRRHDMLSLLALGYGFQVRLAGQVAAAHADAPGPAARPALVAAITGRLALVAESWLGIDPDQVAVTLHHGPGWGRAELTGHGDQRRLRVALPASWLARVWSCGLALTGGHLVVAVERPGWPQARVLALRAPGAEPVPLDVHARGPGGGGDTPHWEV
ncbi:MAG: hypothetical protein ABSB76_05935 [Streptosporangiaceae bacterium]